MLLKSDFSYIETGVREPNDVRQQFLEFSTNSSAAVEGAT